MDFIRAIRLCEGGETVSNGKTATTCAYCTGGVCRQMEACEVPVVEEREQQHAAKEGSNG